MMRLKLQSSLILRSLQNSVLQNLRNFVLEIVSKCNFDELAAK